MERNPDCVDSPRQTELSRHAMTWRAERERGEVARKRAAAKQRHMPIQI
jgi:hypothetical protein